MAIVPNKRPRKLELVAAGCTGDPLEFVSWVTGGVTPVVEIQERGSPPAYGFVRRELEEKFVQKYRWNNSRGLAGSWEPR